jgi:hypothetical protein
LSILVSLPIAAREPGPGAGELSGGPELTVRIYDYAELSSGYLARAADAAHNVYRQAGIETRWIRCRVSLDVPEIHPDCEIEPGPTVLQMKILPEVIAARYGLSQGVLGFALPLREGGFKNVASIFHQRVRKLAEVSGTPPPVILGHVLAHEAGHLLLGMNGHSSKGIMHVPWKVDALKRAEVGGLKFTREQAERMRKQVAARSEAERESRNRGGECSTHSFNTHIKQKGFRQVSP